MSRSPRFRLILPWLTVSLGVVLGSVGEAGSAWAWGDLGHRIVCQIAFQELNDKARAEVIRLMALDSTFDSFTDACTWPDHPRKRAEEHFINVTRTLQTIAIAKCQGVPTCLFTAIETDREVLKASNDDQAKLASLKFLGHWVGDIHQPLHVSFADDRGGNFIRANGACARNLHAVWDVCLVAKAFGSDPATAARQLLDGVPERDKAAWLAVPLAGWADESYQITRRASAGYCVLIGPACVYQAGRESFVVGEGEKVVVVNAAYLDQHAAVVRDRLKQAGIRLAHLLNTTLGQ